MENQQSQFLCFDCEEAPLPPDAQAAPRPADRPRVFDLTADPRPPVLLEFDCEAIDLPPGTLAVPRPPGRERPIFPALPAND